MQEEKIPRLIEDYTGTRARVYGEERAILVAVAAREEACERSLRELESLAATAGIVTLATVIQTRSRPDPATVIGKGKVEEVAQAARALEANVILFDRELTPGQARNLEERTSRKIIDRTQLIMDIFAQHAATKEARLQVELAQLRYLLPRLRGWGDALTRLGGGIGTRGPGETKLELDRNKITRRIHALERRLEKARAERSTQRKQRTRSALPVIAIVGYTNSGKSTLMNRLCSSELLVEDKLFATLSTSVRRGEISPGRVALFIDTVGFIRNLPHHLVPAFSSTLEAAKEADLILHVTDAASPNREEEHLSVRETLTAQVFTDDVPHPPIIDVLNKIDLLEEESRAAFADGVWISAKEGINLDLLRMGICEVLDRGRKEVRLFVPYSAFDIFHRLVGRGESVSYLPAGIETRVTVSPVVLARLRGAGVEVISSASARKE